MPRDRVHSVIGYYVHHRGAGHLHRAMAIAEALDAPVTILSSVARPAAWRGGWVGLPIDTDREPVDPTAGGVLHWVPVGSAGLRARMAAISAWLDAARPDVVVVDVSVEVVALVRLHGVRVVTIVQPGEREDTAHTLGYRLADAIVAPWPPTVQPAALTVDVQGRIEAVGAISRIPISIATTRDPRQIVVMNGAGGRGASALDAVVAGAADALPGWRWHTLQGEPADGVARALRQCTIAFTHCGENAIAEVAASRVPAVLVPESRPHEEQFSMAQALASADVPARVVRAGDAVDWPVIAAALTARGGSGWVAWTDGRAAARAAAIIERVAATAR